MSGEVPFARLLLRDHNEILSSISYFRIALVGNKNSGKSEVRRAYVQLSSKSKVKASQIDSNTIKIHGHQVELLSVDTVQEFAKIPHLIRCNHLDAIVIFYNVDNLRQFESIHHNWIPAIRRLYPGTPFILCATGIDARKKREEKLLAVGEQIEQVFGDSNTVLEKSVSSIKINKPSGFDDVFTPHFTPLTGYQRYITSEMGQFLAKEMGAATFKEVSAKTFENIGDLMETTMNVILQSEINKLALTRHRVGQIKPGETCKMM